MRPISVIVLCLISVAVGAGIDHYWENAGLYWNKIRSLAGSNVPQTGQKTTSPSGVGGVEVLGDRVRCDVRYTELKDSGKRISGVFRPMHGQYGNHEEAGVTLQRPLTEGDRGVGSPHRAVTE